MPHPTRIAFPTETSYEKGGPKGPVPVLRPTTRIPGPPIPTMWQSLWSTINEEPIPSKNPIPKTWSLYTPKQTTSRVCVRSPMDEERLIRLIRFDWLETSFRGGAIHWTLDTSFEVRRSTGREGNRQHSLRWGGPTDEYSGRGIDSIWF